MVGAGHDLNGRPLRNTKVGRGVHLVCFDLKNFQIGRN